jgi:hypothetical protein
MHFPVAPKLCEKGIALKKELGRQPGGVAYFFPQYTTPHGKFVLTDRWRNL